VKAPAEGTVIEKDVSQGTVIASASNSVSGGTTLIKMADLSTVRVRALFNESDIGNIHPGQPANVTMDAYPDRRFGGVVEKIEPQAVVQQNVTMFPVLVNLENGEGLLKPGMNGTIAVLIDERDGVLAIPNDAIKNPREAVATGAMLGLAADSVNNELKAQGYNPAGNRGGFAPGNGGGRRGNRGGGEGGGGNPGTGGAGSTTGAGGGTAGGEVALVTQQGAQQPGGGFGQGGFGMPQVSDADCKKIDDILKAHPKEKKQLDDLAAKLTALRPAGFSGGNRGGGGGTRTPGDSTRRRGGGASAFGGGNQQGGRGTRAPGSPGDSTRRGGGGGGGGGGFRGSPEMQAINEQMRTIETALNIDPRTAAACRRRRNVGGPSATGGVSQSGAQGGAPRAGATRTGGQLTPATELGSRPARPRTGLVFVTDSAKSSFHPRIVRLGQANLDYTEVIDGLKEGEHVVMLGALALQAQRQQFQDRFRQNASPLGGQPGGPRGGGRGR